jgi:formylglycine-generating enzyme
MVSLAGLYDYASLEMKKYVARKFNEYQTPAMRGEINGPFEICPKIASRTITNSIGMKLALIPAGEFMMGSGESAEATAAYFNANYSTDRKAEKFKDEHPQHRVRITRPFYLGVCHVTVGQFRQFVNDEDYKTDAERDGTGGLGYDGKSFAQKPEYTWRNPGFAQTDEHPVVNVSWHDAVAFCEWLSRKEGKKYRLPTEAEWEYACRAGTTTRYWCGDDPEGLARVGNVADATVTAKFPTWGETIAASDGYVFTSPVGSFRPNAFGLYDMHGNACQWCADRYGEDYYAASPTDDPTGPTSGSYYGRVARGGGWVCARLCRSASRSGLAPGGRFLYLGFRVSLVLAE